MGKSLADRRREAAERNETRKAAATVTVYLRSDASAEYDRLNEELIEAVGELDLERKEREAGKPTRVGQKSKAKKRVDDLSAKLDALAEQMKDDTEVKVGLAPKPAGDWNRWKAENPAREEGDGEQRKIIRRDLASGGRFNFDALVDGLAEYVVTLSGDEAEAGDWEAIVLPDITARDLDRVADAVMNLHERSVEIPKSRKLLLAALMSDDD